MRLAGDKARRFVRVPVFAILDSIYTHRDSKRGSRKAVKTGVKKGSRKGRNGSQKGQ
jgi:hypothetical protein